MKSRIRVQVRIKVKSWIQIRTEVKNWIQIRTEVKSWIQILIRIEGMRIRNPGWFQPWFRNPGFRLTWFAWLWRAPLWRRDSICRRRSDCPAGPSSRSADPATSRSICRGWWTGFLRPWWILNQDKKYLCKPSVVYPDSFSSLLFIITKRQLTLNFINKKGVGVSALNIASFIPLHATNIERRRKELASLLRLIASTNLKPSAT